MKRFALIPFRCTVCHRIIWLEPYRQGDVWWMKVKICNKCLNKHNER